MSTDHAVALNMPEAPERTGAESPPATGPVPDALPGVSASPPVRRLHRGHFAFMRSLAQGLDTRQSWERYLAIEGAHSDIRNVRRTIQWIRDEFASAAKRHKRFGVARLVQIDATRVKDKAPALPTLEEFAAEYGLEDFSEAEQIEQYQERYGAETQSQSRRARVLAKQLEAIDWLETLAAQTPPSAEDPLGNWLHPDLVRHLERAGLHTIAQLSARINGLGMRWWSGVRAIGATKAQRIVDWLRANEASIGLAVGPHVLVKRSSLKRDELAKVVSPATAVVPLEKLVIPPALDGAHGEFRAPPQLCRIPARTDLEAVLFWIRSKRGTVPGRQTNGVATVRKEEEGVAAPGPWLDSLSHTQRAYRKEAERFLLWAVVQRKKPLSSMTTADCEAYLAFLANPAPAAQWCAPRGREKWSGLWRPFEGPLSPRAQRQAVAVLKSLYSFLADQCYLIGNPWKALVMRDGLPPIDVQRSFSPAQWMHIESRLAQLPSTCAGNRLRFALPFLYASGLRLSEAVSVRAESLSRHEERSIGDARPFPQSGPWQLCVEGKGKRAGRRWIPLPDSVVEALSLYFASRGLKPDPAHPDNREAHLIGRASDVGERAPWAPAAIKDVDPKAGITAATFGKELRRFFDECAEALKNTDPAAAKPFASASAHWLRHTHGAHAAAAGVPLPLLQKHLGHASLGTTSLYASAGMHDRNHRPEKP